jgi:serine-threonine kinase receptor-associated protein
MCRKVWDTHSGEVMCTLQHNHIVRAVAFPPNEGHLLATGGMEKKLRIFDLSKVGAISNPNATPSQKKMVGSSDTRADGTADRSLIGAEEGFEVGAGVHKGTIKSIVWTKDPNVLVTACDDKAIRWWNLRTQSVVQEQLVQGDIGSCEFTNVLPQQGDIGGGFPVLVIAAGKTVYFYGGQDSRTLIKSINLPYDVASAALHPTQRKFVTGGIKDTWAKVYDYDSEQELGDYSSSTTTYWNVQLITLDVHKGHHGPIWSISFSPDGKLYATGSEDGTIKMWKNCKGPFGLWKADRE